MNFVLVCFALIKINTCRINEIAGDHAVFYMVEEHC